MPMKLCNAPATFQSLMNRVFHDCFLVVYIDDTLIYSDTQAEHLAHICMVLTLLQEHKI